MQRIEVVLENHSGLHARPASMFINTAQQFEANVEIIKDEKVYNGKSIMGLLSMGATKGDKLAIIVEGSDEIQALAAFTKLIESKFGEV